MKNRPYRSLLPLLIIALALVACGGGAEELANSANPPDGRNATIQSATGNETVEMEVEVEMEPRDESMTDGDMATEGSAALRAEAPPLPQATQAAGLANSANDAVGAGGVAQEAIAAVPPSIAETGASAYQTVEIDPDPDLEGMQFADPGVNPFVTTAIDNLSTFAIDVDTGAYTIMRRYLTDSLLPPSNAVRVEEYVNYFNQAYAMPENGAFAIAIEGAPSPYSQGDDYRMVRVGIQGFDVSEAERPDATLIFVIDVSGSMDRQNRLGLVKQALATLVESARPTDQIGIVVYGSDARVVLEPTYAVANRTILAAIDGLRPEGSTNVDAGLRVAYDLADRFAVPGNINRLILLSDGVANVGQVTAETILTHAHGNIALSTFGFGMDSYNDALMEQLANQGDGSYAYIDTLDEANRVFKDQLTSTLFTIAKDAKIQVDFNADVVAEYRLLGYENRDVADSDFRNDSVDAGEIGAGHSVTALYEIRLVPNAPQNAAAMTVHVRYADPSSAEAQEIRQAIALRDFAPRFEDASAHFQLAVSVAEFAEILRHSSWAADSDMAQLAGDVRRIAATLVDDADVAEFSALVALAAQLSQ